jgi:hypothetical protein
MCQPHRPPLRGPHPGQRTRRNSASHLLTEYRERATQGEQAANIFIREAVADLFQGETLNLTPR